MRSGAVKRASTLSSPRTGALKAADQAFSKLVRRSAADDAGHLACFICGAFLPWEEAVAMHCEPRACMSTRYSRINVQAGCSTCNGKPLGDRARFRARLDAVYGEGTAERNRVQSLTTEVFTTEKLKELTKAMSH